MLLGNEEDFTACLGIAVPGADARLEELDPESFKRMIETVVGHYPRLAVAATTLRTVRSASTNDWGALAWSSDAGFVEATHRRGLDVLDRVGGGDSFASGLIYGLATGADLAVAVEFGAAHGARAMTTPGDTSMASLAEVEALVAGAGARVQR